jgi:hypothetical protein
LKQGLGNSIRPIEYYLKNPNVHMWNLSLQRRLWADIVITAGYAGARGIHLMRKRYQHAGSTGARGRTLFYPATAVAEPGLHDDRDEASNGNSA